MLVPSSVIVRREFTSLSRTQMESQGSRSTRRIASTARRATSRTRPRTSTGSHPKAAEDPITRTCRWLSGAALVALMLVPAPVAARIASMAAIDPAQTYVEARTAAMNGDHARSATLLVSLADAEPAQDGLASKALSEAIGS